MRTPTANRVMYIASKEGVCNLEEEYLIFFSGAALMDGEVLHSMGRERERISMGYQCTVIHKINSDSPQYTAHILPTTS